VLENRLVGAARESVKNQKCVGCGCCAAEMSDDSVLPKFGEVTECGEGCAATTFFTQLCAMTGTRARAARSGLRVYIGYARSIHYWQRRITRMRLSTRLPLRLP